MKSGQKGFTIVETLLVLILLAILGFTGYYVWHIQKQTDKTLNVASSEKLATPTKNSISSTSSNSYVGWKTYDNPTLKLSFKYPQGVTISDTTSTSTGGSNFPWYSQTSYVKLVLEFKGMGSTEAKLVVNKADIQTAIGSEGGIGTISRQYKINDLPAYYVTGYGNGGSGSSGIEYVVVGPKYSFVITSTNSSYNGTIESIIQSISL